MGTATEPKGAETVSEYLRWKKDVAQHDYIAATSYLSIRFGEIRAEKVAAELRKLPVITRRANDILRATGRTPLPLSDPGVLKDLKKVLAGQKLSPILVAESAAGGPVSSRSGRRGSRRGRPSSRTWCRTAPGRARFASCCRRSRRRCWRGSACW